MNPGNISITVEIEPIVKLFCTCLACKFNMPTGDSILKEHRAISEGFCMLKHVVIDENGKCIDKAIPQTGNNSDYYNSRQYTFDENGEHREERCEERLPSLPIYRCTLPKGHQGPHLTPTSVEF